MLRLIKLQKNTSSTYPLAEPTQQAREGEEQGENSKLSSKPAQKSEVEAGNSGAGVVVVGSDFLNILSRGGDVAAAVARVRRHYRNADADACTNQPTSDESKRCLQLF